VAEQQRLNYLRRSWLIKHVLLELLKFVLPVAVAVGRLLGCKLKLTLHIELQHLVGLLGFYFSFDLLQSVLVAVHSCVENSMNPCL